MKKIFIALSCIGLMVGVRYVFAANKLVLDVFDVDSPSSTCLAKDRFNTGDRQPLKIIVSNHPTDHGIIVVTLRNPDTSDVISLDMPQESNGGITSLFAGLSQAKENIVGSWIAVAQVPGYEDSDIKVFKVVNDVSECAGKSNAGSNNSGVGNQQGQNNSLPGNNATEATNNSTSQGGIDLTIQDVEALIMGATCWIMRVSVAVMVLFILYTGFLFMSAQGVPAAQQKAQASLKYVLLGIAVIVGVYTIIGTVALAVGRNDFSFKTCSSVQ